jgi:hypothetical protein
MTAAPLTPEFGTGIGLAAGLAAALIVMFGAS